MSSKKRIIEESDEGDSPMKRTRVDDKAAAAKDDSDDDIPISQLVKKSMEEKKAALQREDSDDSDDDIPIAELIKRKMEAEKAKVKSPSAKAPPKSASSKPSTKTEPKKSAVTSSTKSSSRGPSKSACKGDAHRTATVTDSYYTTAKGRLTQKLLVRWWYVITWPDPQDVSDPPPPGYEALEGFPGVFVSTAVESMGNIIDRRDKKTCPSLRCFSRKASAELKELCIRAIEEQIQQLVEAEGADTRLEKTLRAELREVKAINTDKADKEAAKLFKTAF